MVGVKDSQGKSIFEGKEVTGFSNKEEETVGMVEVKMPECPVITITGLTMLHSGYPIPP